MGAVATPYSRNMDSVSAKDVFPASIASHDISPIWLHEYIALPGPLRIVEGCACRSSFCLSYARMIEMRSGMLRAATIFLRRWMAPQQETRFSVRYWASQAGAPLGRGQAGAADTARAPGVTRE